jgi:hypothetical protein
MRCRSCGLEIADKAIVCYRCGTPTMDAAPRPARRASPRPGWMAVPLMALIIALAVWLVPRTPAGSVSRWLAWIGVVLVTAGVVTWLRRR